MHLISKRITLEIETLIKKCIGNNRKAQNQLFEIYSEKLYMKAFGYIKNHHRTEEIVVTAFLKIFQSIEHFKYEGEIRFIAWMKRIVINEALMEIRRMKQMPVFINEFPEIISTSVAVDYMYYEEIMTLIERLPKGYKLVFKLYVIEGFNHTEIADLLMISEGTSKSQLHKARFQLQQMLIKNEMNYG